MDKTFEAFCPRGKRGGDPLGPYCEAKEEGEEGIGGHLFRGQWCRVNG